jgi:hypothetical protein
MNIGQKYPAFFGFVPNIGLHVQTGLVKIGKLLMQTCSNLKSV